MSLRFFALPFATDREMGGSVFARRWHGDRGLRSATFQHTHRPKTKRGPWLGCAKFGGLSSFPVVPGALGAESGASTRLCRLRRLRAPCE